MKAISIGRFRQLVSKSQLATQFAATVAIGILLLIAIGPAELVGPYVSYIINLLLIYAIGTLAVSMLSHSAGIWSIGHTAFMAIGAYLSANMSVRGYSVETIILAAVLISLVIGFLVGSSAGRFSTLYMALLTLAMGMVSIEVIGRWRSVTGGDEGIEVAAARLLFFDRPLKPEEVVMMTVAVAMAVFLIAQIVFKGTRGKRWLAIKSQRLAAMSIGFRPHIENALAFGFSGALASTAGVCMAFSMRYISPEAFLLEVAVMMVLCAVVGGVGSISGALLGGMFLALVPEMAREVPGASAYVFGTATVLVLLFLPAGIVPGISRIVRRRLSAVLAWGKKPYIGAFDESSRAEDLSDGISAKIGEIMTGAKETLIVDGLSVSFGGLMALEDVSLQVAPGQVVGLIGPNGAGKTTLLNVLSGYVSPTSGRAVSIGDTDLATLPAYARTWHGFGRTFQHAELFGELPIREGIFQAALQGAKVRKKAAMNIEPVEVTDRLIEALRLRPYAEAYPAEVPFGIQKVADIARALATGAQIIAMDEPFSGLDTTERDEVRAILHAMRKAGVSILIIDHVVQEVFTIADHVVVLDFGRILASGPPSQIQNDPRVLQAYLGSAVAEEEVQSRR